MLHESIQNQEEDKAAPRKAKLGVKLFIVYTLVYSGFVIIGLSKPEWMGMEMLGGQNLAIIYGFSLIILAIIMGFIYNYFCSKLEDELNK